MNEIKLIQISQLGVNRSLLGQTNLPPNEDMFGSRSRCHFPCFSFCHRIRGVGSTGFRAQPFAMGFALGFHAGLRPTGGLGPREEQKRSHQRHETATRIHFLSFFLCGGWFWWFWYSCNYGLRLQRVQMVLVWFNLDGQRPTSHDVV